MNLPIQALLPVLFGNGSGVIRKKGVISEGGTNKTWSILHDDLKETLSILHGSTAQVRGNYGLTSGKYLWQRLKKNLIGRKYTFWDETGKRKFLFYNAL